MTFRLSRNGAVRGLLLFVGTVTMTNSEAGILNSLFDSSISIQLETHDTSGSPIPAATVWRIYDGTGEESPSDYMPRLLQRFGEQADYIQNIDLNQVLVSYTNDKGVFFDTDKAAWLKTKKLRAYFAVIKRGYKSVLITEDVPRGETYRINVTLERDPSQQFDPCLLEFDLLRAMPNASAKNAEEVMQPGRRNTTLSAAQRMRELALAFEQEGKRELASMVYLNLAYLPSVDTMQTDHGEVIIGYTNGFDEKIPQRKADMRKAIELNQHNPNLAIDKFFNSIVGEGRSTFDLSDKERLTLIKGMESIIFNATQGILPLKRGGLSIWYRKLKMFEEACAALNWNYAYEPMDVKLDREVAEITKAAQAAGRVDFRCSIKDIKSTL